MWILPAIGLVLLFAEDLPVTPDLTARALARISPERAKSTVNRLAGFGTRHSFSETTSTDRGIGAARRYLLQELERIGRENGGRLEVSAQPFDLPEGRRIPKDAPGQENIIAMLRGTSPAATDRYYVILGHYDSIPSPHSDAKKDAPGADDNASGTAVVLEVAAALASESLDSTILFVCTASEEQGLYGAAAVADWMEVDGIDVRAALNNDIVGDPTGPPFKDGSPREDRTRVRVFSEGLPSGATEKVAHGIRRLGAESESSSRQLARYVSFVAKRRQTELQPMLVFRPDRFLRGGDHTEFNRIGVAAIRFTEVYETYTRQHQAVEEKDGVPFGDVPEFVDAGYLAAVARLNAAVLVEMANAPSIPEKVRIKGGLSNDTTLAWERSPEPDTAGYEVVWRATTAPDWEHSVDVGDHDEAVLELSKDNWFFGVRAYDVDGYRSPVGTIQP